MIRTFLWSLKDSSEASDRIDFPFPENISLPSSLNILTPEQAIEFLLLLSQGNRLKDCSALEFVTSPHIDKSAMKSQDDESSSSAESVSEFVDTELTRVNVQTVQTVEIKHISTENLPIPTVADKTNEKKTEPDLPEQSEPNMQIAYIDDEPRNDPIVPSALVKSDVKVDTSVEQITGEICQRKIDELKQLLNDAHRAATNIVSSREKLDSIDKGKEHDTSVSETKTGDSPSVDTRDTIDQRSVTPSSSSCIFDGDNRAGKYHKKPAPRAPLANETANDAGGIDEDESQNALKATLVIKTGTLRTVSNPDVTKDIFLAHTSDSTKKKKKKSGKSRAKEGFTKLLTIPKNIFHSAFHKEQSEDSSKEEDSSSTFSGTSESVSRSGSVGSQTFMDLASAKPSTSKQEANVEEIILRTEYEDGVKNPDKDISTSIEKPIAQTATLSSKDETVLDKAENDKKRAKNSEDGVMNVENKFKFETREMSRPRDGKKEIVTDIN